MDTSKLNATGVDGAVRTAPGARGWRMLTLNDRLGRETAVVAWLAAAIGLGLYAGWGWIVAAGFVSLVLAVLPCAAMCALGLCGASVGKKCSDQAVTSATRGTNT